MGIVILVLIGIAIVGLVTWWVCKEEDDDEDMERYKGDWS